MVHKIYFSTAKRENYNKLLRYMVSTTNIVERYEKGENLANIVNELLNQNILEKEQIQPILRLLLVERSKLPFKDLNLNNSFSNFGIIIQNFQKWNAIDLVVAYYHPTYGIILINPANQSHWERVHELKKDEYIVVYGRSKNGNNEIAKKGIEAFFSLIENKQPEEDPQFISVKIEQIQKEEKKEEEKEKPTEAKKIDLSGLNITPKYSVQVTNELFHNGNVEAWKNIIESYHTKYPQCKVIVYHEGELIQDLNSLFKWGKVKHGGVIMFQVVGKDIKGVSRLQKYLYEGASPRFESFLKKDVNKVLNLF